MDVKELSVDEVQTGSELNRFIKFPWKIYAGNPNWVPPLLMERKAFFDKKKNPFYRYANVRLLLARRGGEIVGRIATCINHTHNDFHNEKIGFFGFFEVIEDYDVARRLFKTAMIMLKKDGMEVMRGPVNFSTNHEVGLLIDAFDSPPMIMMTYNPPYYVEFFERFGFNKAKDLLAFRLTEEAKPPARVVKVIDRIKQRCGATFRTIRMNEFNREIERVFEIYNDAWQYNWGFVPLHRDEFIHIAKDLKQVVEPELVFIAEVDGNPAAFLLALPDINQVLGKANGRLFPTGLAKILWNTKVRNKIDQIRVITLGVAQKYQKRGIDNVFYYDIFQSGRRLGYKRAELSWILEENALMISAIETLGGDHYKTYRVYDAPLSGAAAT